MQTNYSIKIKKYAKKETKTKLDCFIFCKCIGIIQICEMLHFKEYFKILYKTILNKYNHYLLHCLYSLCSFIHSKKATKNWTLLCINKTL